MRSIVLDAKVADLAEAVMQLDQMSARQRAFRNDVNYDVLVHAAAIAQGVQSVYTRLEAILKYAIALAGEEVPPSASWHRDLLTVCAAENPGVRPPIISKDQAVDLSRLLGFRHVVRMPYSGELRLDDVERNVNLLLAVAPGVLKALRDYSRALFSESEDDNPDPSLRETPRG